MSDPGRAPVPLDDLPRVRAAAHLFDPVAADVIGQLIDEIERLRTIGRCDHLLNQCSADRVARLEQKVTELADAEERALDLLSTSDAALARAEGRIAEIERAIADLADDEVGIDMLQSAEDNLARISGTLFARRKRIGELERETAASHAHAAGRRYERARLVARLRQVNNSEGTPDAALEELLVLIEAGQLTEPL